MAAHKDRQPGFESNTSSGSHSGPVSDGNIAAQTYETDATIPPDANLSDASVMARSAPNAPAMPKEFDGYELIEEIARGGMGIVYKAYQKSLDRVVALKTVLAGDLASEEAIRLFHTEARAAGKLNHPGIVPVYDVGECHGFHYFSMPLIDGVSLADRVARGPMDPDEAARFMKMAAETIHFAHKHNIIHRDLKPGNILVDFLGRPLITDFGIARKIDDRHTPGEQYSLTGTAEYMPPEQASGESTGPLGDVYSLGATLYCLLTGRPPFQSSNTLDTLMAVLHSDPVPPRRLNERIPRDIELICLKCIEKRPQDRYQSALEVAEELERFLEGRPVLVHPVGNIGTFIRWTRRKPRSAALATALVVCFTAALAISVYYNFQLDMQRNIADEARREAEFSELSASRLQRVTEALLEQLATAESGVVQALQYSSLGEVCSAATKLSRATLKVPRNQALGDFRTARSRLSDEQEAELRPLLDQIEEAANRKEGDPDATTSAADNLIAQARGIWLSATEGSPGARKQIRTVLYARTHQLVEKIVAATDRRDVADDIKSLLDLMNAELSVVATDEVYLKAVQMLVAVEEWRSGPLPQSLITIAGDLQRITDRPDPNQS